MSIRNRIRFFNKHYQTPIIVAPMEDGFLIALTYGPKVDWYRNILEAGHCKLQWHRREYEIARIAPVAASQAGPYLPGFERGMLRLLGVEDFAKMWRSV